MGKVLVFIYDKMVEFEMTFALNYLVGLGQKELVTIAYGNEPVTSMCGIEYKPKTTVREALNLPDVEGLIITGGRTCDFRPELQELICKLDGEKKLLAAICAGPQYLAKSGVLTGRKYTTSLHEWLPQVEEVFGAVDPFPRESYLDQRFVRDGHIITAKGHAFLDFGFEIMNWFELFSSEEERAEYAQIFSGK